MGIGEFNKFIQSGTQVKLRDNKKYTVLSSKKYENDIWAFTLENYSKEVSCFNIKKIYHNKNATLTFDSLLALSLATASPSPPSSPPSPSSSYSSTPAAERLSSSTLPPRRSKPVEPIEEAKLEEIYCPICLEDSQFFTTFNCKGKHAMCNKCYKQYVDSCHGDELKCVQCREVMKIS